jgi:hypothetical protein
MMETTFLATSEKLCPLRRSLDRPGVAGCEEAFDGDPALGRFEIALGYDGAVLADAQDIARIVEMRVQGCQPFVPHQHQEIGLRHPFRVGRIKAAGAIFDRIAAVCR